MHMTRIILTGPESTGKTTMAQVLATQLQAPCVPEFARVYLQYLGRLYRREDLWTIAQGQSAWENWYGARHPKRLVLDTNWTVIRIWEIFQFGTSTVTEHCSIDPADYYLLCAPDIPWEPDPLRENAGERGVLYALYHQLLQQTGARFSILSGTHHERLAAAQAIIRDLC
jgi:nicotinamide riboside kinase